MISSKPLYHAKYLLEEIYPVLNDTKMLLVIFHQITDYFSNLFSSLHVFESSLSLREQFIQIKDEFLPEDIAQIEQIIRLQEVYEESSVAFSRKEKFLFSDDSYDFSELSSEKLKTILSFAFTLHTKRFLH